MAIKTRPPVLDSLLQAFERIPDPRIDRRMFHPLVNVLTMALCGAICGADGWEALEMYAQERADFFRTFLDLPRGTPSADTFRRVFEMIDPQAFQEAFRAWLRPFLDNLEGQTIALDGKTLRGALAHTRGQSGAFHLMHVWATEQRLLLAQQAVTGAPGETSAAIELLKFLDLRGATVTADANFCAADMSHAIRNAGAHYVLALKGNRGTLHRHVLQLFEHAPRKGVDAVPSFESRDNAHGRIELRIVRALPLNNLPPRISETWADLRTAILVERIRAADEVSLDRALYVTSLTPDPKTLAATIRGHWSIENQLHHCLDVSFSEDRRRIHDEHGAQNFALVTRYALSMLKRHPAKLSVAMKRRKAAWGGSYLLDVLTAGFPQL